MKWQTWRKVTFILAIVGVILFFILISIAMIFYAGGHSLDPSASGYSFLYNTWSDLGRPIAWSGRTNLHAQVFFSMAMVVWGISFVPSIQALSSFFSESRQGKSLTKIGTIFAVICVLALFCEVFFFPVDLYPDSHNLFSFIGYLSLFIVEILFAIVMFSDKKYPNKYAIFFLAVAVVIIIYSLFGAAILQKSVSITLTIATIIVFADALKRMNKEKV